MLLARNTIKLNHENFIYQKSIKNIQSTTLIALIIKSMLYFPLHAIKPYKEQLIKTNNQKSFAK